MGQAAARTRPAVLRSRAAYAGALLIAVAVGCVSPIASKNGPLLELSWLSLAADSCHGSVLNVGVEVAAHSRVQLLYATAAGETARVVTPAPENVPSVHELDMNFALLSAPPQLTNGEPRYPRVGAITWDGGGVPAQPRAPALSLINVGTVGPDSLGGYVYNTGGWAYHVVMTVENRDGIVAIPTTPEFFGPRQQGHFTSANHNAASGSVRPKLLKLSWEDYGGHADSVLSPVAH